MRKKIRIIISLIVGIVVLLFAAYKITYNSLAPMVFDYILQKNPEALLKIDDISTDNAEGENTENATENNENGENSTDEKTANSTSEKNDNSKSENGSKSSENNENSGKSEYSTHTSIGSLSAADLAKVIKNISPSDKTRIISICKSAVSAQDMPRFAKMAKNGMSGEDWAYAESYLRSALSASQKQEILDIVKKYL